MKRLWQPMLIAGILLLVIVMIVTPFMLVQTFTTESVACLDTPLKVFADAYCRWMISDKMWMLFTVAGVLLTVAALVIRHKEKKKK